MLLTIRAKSVFLSNAVDGPPLLRCGCPSDLHEVAVEVAVPLGDGLCHRCKSHFWANQTPTYQDFISGRIALGKAPVPPPLIKYLHPPPLLLLLSLFACRGTATPFATTDVPRTCLSFFCTYAVLYSCSMGLALMVVEMETRLC
jgi:hypothetical protein